MKKLLFSLIFLVCMFSVYAQDTLFFFQDGQTFKLNLMGENTVKLNAPYQVDKVFLGAILLKDIHAHDSSIKLYISPLIVLKEDLVDMYFSILFNKTTVYSICLEMTFSVLQSTGYYPKSIDIWGSSSISELNDGVTDEHLGKLEFPSNAINWTQRVYLKNEKEFKYLTIGPSLNNCRKSKSRKKDCNSFQEKLFITDPLSLSLNQTPYIQIKKILITSQD